MWRSAPATTQGTRQLGIATQVTAAGSFSVSIAAPLRSLSGAPVEPFSATVELRSKTLSYGAPLHPDSPALLRSAAARISGSIDFSADGRTLSFTPDGRWPINANFELPVNRFNYIDRTTAPLSDAVSGTQRTPAFSTGVLP